jgi:hypothetical protein
MMSNLASCHRALRVSALLLGAVALLLIAGVIPPVQGDTSPLSAPERASAGLWVVVGLNLVAVGAVLVLGGRAIERGGLLLNVLWVPALLALLCALAFVDAGAAFAGHGPPLRSATILLFTCSVLDLVAAGLIAASAVGRWRVGSGPAGEMSGA